MGSMLGRRRRRRAKARVRVRVGSKWVMGSVFRGRIPLRYTRHAAR
jgi:hypothetical protein